MTTTVSRRTLAKGAAWSVPVVAVAASAPAASASPAECIKSGIISNSPDGLPATANFTCVQTDKAGTPTGTKLGSWFVQVLVSTCTAVHAGSTLKSPPSITANVKTTSGAASVLRGLAGDNPKITSGSSAAGYTLTGNVVNSGATRTGNLTVAAQDVPASGPITTEATGSGVLETSTTAGSITIAVGSFSVILNYSGNDPDSGDPITGTTYIACDPIGGNIAMSPAIVVQ